DVALDDVGLSPPVRAPVPGDTRRARLLSARPSCNRPHDGLLQELAPSTLQGASPHGNSSLAADAALYKERRLRQWREHRALIHTVTSGRTQLPDATASLRSAHSRRSGSVLLGSNRSGPTRPLGLPCTTSSRPPR